MRSSTLRIVGVAAAVMFAACNLPDSSVTDSGVIIGTDGGGSKADSGTTTTDSGITPADAGTTAVDAGTTPADAGTTPTDAGTTPTDAGTTPVDAGTTPVDAGFDFFSRATAERRVGYLASDEMRGRDEGSAESALARTFIINELTACGVAPHVANFVQPIIGGDGTNILGQIVGTDSARNDRFVIISAHYDHIGANGSSIYNGAQDNATSVAAVLAVACAIANDPLPRSVLVALWDAEEPDTFLTDAMGSQYFTKHPTLELSKIDVAIALDLVGGNMWGTEQGHNVLGAELSTQVKAALDSVADPAGITVRRGGLHLVEEIDPPIGSSVHQPWSDYDAFRNNLVPVLFFSDGQNVRYHTTTDDVSFVDFAKLVKEASFLHSVTRALASATTTPVFLPNGTDHLRDCDAVLAILTMALAPTTGLVDTFGLSTSSKNKLESDLGKVTTLKNKLAGGGNATDGEVQSLRSAIQRVMCQAAKSQSQIVCNLL